MSTIKLKASDIQCNICEQWYDETMELCPSCNKKNQCNICEQWYDEAMELCPSCNKKNKPKTNKPKTSKSKITGIPENIQSDKIDEYPALSFIIVLYSILSIIGFIASIIIFVIYIADFEFTLEALLIMGCTWIGLIILYSYTELIKIFIRIEKNTRK